MKLLLIIFSFSSVIMFSCAESGPPKTIAGDMCDCFQLAEKNLSSETKEAIKNSALAEDPEYEWDFQVSKLDSAKRAIVKKEINDLFPGYNKYNAFNDCLKKVDSSYFDKDLTEQQKKPELRKALEKMKMMKDCDLGYRFMTMLLNLSDKAAKRE